MSDLEIVLRKLARLLHSAEEEIAAEARPESRSDPAPGARRPVEANHRPRPPGRPNRGAATG